VTEVRLIRDITIGDRHRRELGDVEGLARSIADVGLLHPIVITPDDRLIAGERRLRAFELLGRERIPVTVVPLDQIARGELSENAFRKDFLPSEIDAIRRTLEPLERAAAKGRQGTRTDKHPGKFPGSSGTARDKVGAVVGMSGRTVEKIAAVVKAAEEDPETFGKLVENMDRTGRVNGPYRRLTIMRQAAAIRAEPPPLPGNGPYRVATCDVPWPSEPDDPDPSERAYWPFPTMSIEQMCALDVGSIMHRDSVLWFWVTNFHMPYAYRVLDAWGFHERPTILTWGKDRPGRGQRLLGQTEHAIMAMRGKPVVTLTNQTTWLRAPAPKPLGRKPPEFYDLVESLCPASRYADLFSRYQHNDKWDCHGDQAGLFSRVQEAAE
jgi:N6-adenosine-specific RNA methylase IME4